MKTKAMRLYGKSDIRVEEFELPEMGEDEILARVVTDSLCMSSYKAAIQGSDHKRVPDDVAENPTIMGHEFCGEIIKVGAKHKAKFKPGQKFVIQPALNHKGTLDAPGYSFQYVGGDATYIIIPDVVMEMNCLFPFDGEAFYFGSLAEPVSCVAGAFHANYHSKQGSYTHDMGIKNDGNCAILAGCGPMGLCAIEYAIKGDKRPKLLVVTDIDDTRLERAAKFISPEMAKQYGVTLIYKNTSGENAEAEMLELSGGAGYDDVFVFAAVASVVEMGDRLLGNDGCMNFFAGPADHNFCAKFNFFNVHYARTHIAGTSGGNNDDLLESVELMSSGALDPSFMVTHIGGLNVCVETTLNLPNIPGGKKLIYTNLNLPLVALDELRAQGGELFTALADIVEKNGGVWSPEAEQFLMANGETI